MAKPIKCEQTTLLVTKEIYLFCYKLDLYFNDLQINDMTLHFSFWISTVNPCHKIGATTLHGRKYFSVNRK